MTETEIQPSKTSLKIAVYYPYFAGGGAEAVGLWILEALQEKYKLTLFTLCQLDFDQLNFLYGTNLSADTIEIKSLFPSFLENISNFFISNNTDIKQLVTHWVIRYLKEEQENYDLVISGYNAADLGKKAIQYIHWIKVIDTAKPIYKKISNFSDEQLKSNLSMANSYTVAEEVKKTYGINPVVVYPPVVLKVVDIPWEEKEDAFICSGRLVNAKQPHKAIQILNKVRQRGFDIKLYLTGGGGGIYGWKYKRFLDQMVKTHASWVTLYENLDYEDYAQILYKCKYGIHYKQEPFGISIAEMVKAGAIPFVKRKGGQVEIVGKDNEDLFFDKDEEAVEKIINVLRDRDKQQNLRQALENQKQLFSTERFVKEINNVVDSYFNKNELS